MGSVSCQRGEFLREFFDHFCIVFVEREWVAIFFLLQILSRYRLLCHLSHLSHMGLLDRLNRLRRLCRLCEGRNWSRFNLREKVSKQVPKVPVRQEPSNPHPIANHPKAILRHLPYLHNSFIAQAFQTLRPELLSRFIKFCLHFPHMHSTFSD